MMGWWLWWSMWIGLDKKPWPSPNRNKSKKNKILGGFNWADGLAGQKLGLVWFGMGGSGLGNVNRRNPNPPTNNNKTTTFHIRFLEVDVHFPSFIFITIQIPNKSPPDTNLHPSPKPTPPPTFKTTHHHHIQIVLLLTTSL